MAINTNNYFKTYAQALYENGYSVIPLVPNEKKPEKDIETFIEKHCPELNPKLQGWNRLRDIDQNILEAMIQQYSNSSVGILTFNTPAIDIDIRDEKAVNAIIEEIKPLLDDGVVLKRIGQPPQLLIPCQYDGELYSKILGSLFYDAEEVARCRKAKKKIKCQKVEILSNGQQFVTSGIHPDTRKPYEWITEQKLREVKRSELPYLPEDKARLILEKANSVIKDNSNLTTEKPGVEESKTTVCVPENYSIDDSRKLSDELKHKLEQYRFWLKFIPATVGHDEWTGILMALHKEGEGRAEFYQLGRDWSKTIATLALVFELVNNPTSHNYTISMQSMALAYNWFDYLKSHAEAVYAVANHADEEGAKLLLARRDKLGEVFTVRDIKQKHWIGLKTTKKVEQALEVLEESKHIQSITIPTAKKGGRPTVNYIWNK